MIPFLEYIIKSLVDSPEKISIKKSEEDDRILIEIDAASHDMGKLIGKNGQTVKAIRTIMNVSALKAKKKVMLDIREVPGDNKADTQGITNT
ncbi:KH domain-containing protein [Candidatus Desantisbacteria bacterium]|nr:KH domain-containing protein [Candidatus Desantisbacteria bacterium]